MSVDNVNGPLQLLHPDWVNMDVSELGKSFYNCENQPLSDAVVEIKIKVLRDASLRKDLNMLALYLRLPEGLVSNELRMMIWPQLLSLDDADNLTKRSSLTSLSSPQSTPAPSSMETSIESSEIGHDAAQYPISKLRNIDSAKFLLQQLESVDLPEHRDEGQVKLDIQRLATILSQLSSVLVCGTDVASSCSTYTKLLSQTDMDASKKHLFNLMVRVLRKYPVLNYYQGYHDVASVILVVCYCHETQSVDEELAFRILESLTILHLRDFMVKDVGLSLNHLRLIPKVLEVAEPTMFDILKRTNSMFVLSNGGYYDYNFFPGLSSILTVFSHDLVNVKHTLLLWDFMLGYNSVLTNVYVYVASLIYFKDRILDDLGFKSVDEVDIAKIDIDQVHTSFSPGNLLNDINDTDILVILKIADSLIKDHGLDVDPILAADGVKLDWMEFNRHSTLLTTSRICYKQEDRIKNHSDYNFLFESTAMADWIDMQNEEITKQTRHEVLLQHDLFAIQDVHSQLESEGTLQNLLSSSFASLSSDSSFPILHVLKSSSVILKRVLKLNEQPLHEKDDENRHNNSGAADSWSLIYKVSITIGVLGVLIHFFAARYNTSLLKLISPPYQLMVDELKVLRTGLIREAHVGINIFCAHAVRGSHIGQIGLGNIKSTIFGFS